METFNPCKYSRDSLVATLIRTSTYCGHCFSCRCTMLTVQKVFTTEDGSPTWTILARPPGVLAISNGNVGLKKGS